MIPPNRSALRHLLAGICVAACAANAWAGPTEDALKVGEEALAKGDAVSASTTWINAYNERAVEKTATDETCAKLLWNAGTLFANTGNLADALGCFEKLYPLRIELSGPASPETAKVASTLAITLVNSGGDVDRAERLIRESIDILSKADAAKPLDLFNAIGNLGGILLAKKDRLGANQQFIECLRFAELHPNAGITDELIAATYDSLAQIAGFFGRNADKLRYLQRSLELKTKAKGKHDIAVILARLELAAALTGEQAMSAYESMLADLYEAPKSDSDAKMQQAWTVVEYRLAILESQQGHQDRVVSLLESAIRHGTKGYGELHPELLQLNLDLAKLYLTRKQYDKGIACYRQVLAIRKKHLGDDHESTKETQRMLDDLMADLAKLKAK